MPEFKKVRVNHELPIKKVSQKLDKKIKDLRKEFRDELKEYKIKYSWNKDKTECNFSGKYLVFKAEGTLEVNQKSVIVSGKLPHGMPERLREKIRRIVREEIKDANG